MAKAKTLFTCSQCGNQSPKWLGKCPDCNAWNSYVEEVVSPKAESKMVRSQGISSGRVPKKIKEIESSEKLRYDTGIPELNRVLGGGLVKGSLTLISGDPGIGKSTLLLQTCGKISIKGPVLYVSGEESEEQIKMRADRLNIVSDNIFIVSETSLSSIERHIESIKPVFVIIDSVQTIFSENITSAPGSVSQVRECSSELMRIGKVSDIPLFIVAHVTKSGELAGPRVLEHMVDTVLSFEGERTGDVRVLRTMKNRFGTTSEIGIFEMSEEGLKEVFDPSGFFLNDSNEEGTCTVGILEGTRPILAQIQSLVAETKIVMPRRTAVGMDLLRLNMIIAVIEKKLRIPFYSSDVFVNVAGGLNLDGVGADLGILIALISSIKSKSIKDKTIAIGEIGLTGEIRPVSGIERIIIEAEKLGFTTCITSTKANIKHKAKSMEIIKVSNVKELYEKVFR